jgi:hypothetical protein
MYDLSTILDYFKTTLIINRVTRLGEFSSIVQLFIGQIFKYYRNTLNLWSTLFHGKNFDNKCVRLYFERFFHKLIWSP